MSTAPYPYNVHAHAAKLLAAFVEAGVKPGLWQRVYHAPASRSMGVQVLTGMSAGMRLRITVELPSLEPRWPSPGSLLVCLQPLRASTLRRARAYLTEVHIGREPVLLRMPWPDILPRRANAWESAVTPLLTRCQQEIVENAEVLASWDALRAESEYALDNPKAWHRKRLVSKRFGGAA